MTEFRNNRSIFVCDRCAEDGLETRVVISVLANGQSQYVARCPVCTYEQREMPTMRLEHEDVRLPFPTDPKSAVHVIAATTMRTPIVSLAYHQSMMMAPRILRDAGIQFSEIQLPGGSIQFGRNRLASAFLNRTNASHLLFIDDDVRFDPKDIARMVAFDRDVVAGAYATREIAWSRVVDMAQRGVSSDAMARFASPLAARFLRDTAGALVHDDEHRDLLEAEYVATGFLLIKRHVLEKMVAFYKPTLSYWCAEDDEYQTAIFEAGVRNGMPFSEDTLWSKRWREELGGRLWIDGRASFGHNGEYEFRAASPLEQIERATTEAPPAPSGV